TTNKTNMEEFNILAILSKDHEDIASHEFITVLGLSEGIIKNRVEDIKTKNNVEDIKNKTRKASAENIRKIGNIICCNIPKIRINDLSRLAYTNAVYRILFTTTKRELISDMERFNWQKHYDGDLCFRTINSKAAGLPAEERHLASLIWKRLDKPKVSLGSPKTLFSAICCPDRIYACKLLWKNSRQYEKRRAHLRPCLHPSSLSPKLAIACINMTGIRRKGSTVLDPFCGSAGILIEAGLMGFHAKGIDTEKSMVFRAKKNLDHYGISDYSLSIGNALSIRKGYDFVVTDLPYGKNTRSTEIASLYSGFLCVLKKILKKKAVIIFPGNVNYKDMIKKQGLKIKKEFNVYIHKSMEKRVVVISP
ncbi:methyltransferase domain-containing protein, partial [Candidatus Woesearchaeota archaeon]|nr:methyltransferase domain-containing protein [Candidatus Woesearchaeota archaeon]